MTLSRPRKSTTNSRCTSSLTAAIGTPASIVVVKITGICSSMSLSTRGTITFGGRFGSCSSSSGLVTDGIGFRFKKRSGSMNGSESTPRRSGTTFSLHAVESLPAGLVAITRYWPTSCGRTSLICSSTCFVPMSYRVRRRVEAASGWSSFNHTNYHNSSISPETRDGANEYSRRVLVCRWFSLWARQVNLLWAECPREGWPLSVVPSFSGLLWSEVVPWSRGERTSRVPRRNVYRSRLSVEWWVCRLFRLSPPG